MEKFIAYYRLSKLSDTEKGIGLDAQRHAVKTFTHNKGQIIREFEEIETGTNKKKRVKIYEAMQACQELKATLLIARLDRLTRDTDFLTDLRRSGVSFTAVDFPSINTLMVDVIISFAKEEAACISARTRAALAELKRQGKKLGKDRFKPEHQILGAAAMKQKAVSNLNNIKATDLIIDLRDRGMTFQAITNRLNMRHDTTSTGKPFSSCAVHRLYSRARLVGNSNEV